MASLSARVRPLRWIGRQSRIEVLGAVLRAASAGEEAHLIADELLHLAERHPDSLAVPLLVSRWTLLSDGQRSRLTLLVGGDWPALAACMVIDADSVTRQSIAKACAEAGGLGVLAGPALVPLLADHVAAVAESAEDALGAFMRQLAERTLDRAGQERARATAEATIESFDRHRRGGALRLAIQHGLVAPGGKSMKWMADPDHPAHMVVRGLIRTSTDAAMRSCAWGWLKHESLAPACAERLTRSDGLSEQSLVLERSYLALNPRRTSALHGSARVGEEGYAGALPRLTQFDGLSLAARCGLARWIESLPITRRLRDAASAILLTDQEPLVRQSLVISATRASLPPACLHDLVFDVNEHVATSAAEALLARTKADRLTTGDSDGVRLLKLLSRSSHEPLRALAAQLNGAQSVRESQAAFADAMRVTERFAREGVSAVSPRAAASAVVTLASIEHQNDARVDEVLLRATTLPDARVRANAVEGLLRRARRAGGPLGGRITDLLEEKADDPHHRIRANAARALLLSGLKGRSDSQIEHHTKLTALGSRTLAGLLTDGRTMHRVAGLWLAHRLGETLSRQVDQPATGSGSGLLERVVHAAGRASDPLERLWAERARARIESSIREDWATRAVAFEEAAA